MGRINRENRGQQVKAFIDSRKKDNKCWVVGCENIFYFRVARRIDGAIKYIPSCRHHVDDIRNVAKIVDIAVYGND